ncbi:MAG: SURF1 family protein [Paraperlucidibaca sp.]
MSVAASTQAPSFWAWLLLVVVAAVLLSLAYWQYQRGEEKTALLSQRAERAATAELTWRQADKPVDDISNRPMRLSGRFMPQYTIALDNQLRAGRAGVELLVLFQPQDSRSSVLVNIGWVPSDRNGGPSLPKTLPADGEIFGVLHKPSAFITLGGPELLADVWRVGRIEPSTWASRWQQDIKPWVLRLDASVPGGYLRDWAPTSEQKIGPERHRAYAFQWLALALAWCGCWYALWRKGLARV